MSDLFVHELLWRGWPASGPNAAPAAWHVALGREDVALPGEDRPAIRTVYLSQDQAEAAGWPLTRIIPAINEAALTEVTALRQERDTLLARLAELEPAIPAAPVGLISDRQFFQALANAGAISQGEALAAVKTGDLPARIATAVAALPDAQRFDAEMNLSGATSFRRDHRLVEQFGAILGYDAAALDALWAAAALLE